MEINLLDLIKQYKSIQNEIDSVVLKVLERGQYILGPNVEAFEEEIAEFTGTNHGIGVANGTDALLLTLKAYDIGEGDEVITTPFTFFATAEVISQAGAIPVFVDIDKDTYNMDINKIEENITEKTKAIIPVHIFGQPVDMDKVLEIAEKYNLIVIEDACQAIGAEYKSKKVGSIGHAACFSFFPTKNLGCYGDGGMIVTSDNSIVEKLNMLRFHGQRVKYHNEMLGYNSRLDEIQAAMLRVKLRYLNEWNNKRNYLAKKYNEKLINLPLKTPKEIDNIKHVYHLYIVQSEERDELIKFLKKSGISTGVYYPIPLHLQEVYKSLTYKEGDFENSEYCSKRTFALPLYPELKEKEQDYIIDKIKEFYENK
ncbi:pleiotropic regulatory protein DegT [Gottschalkia purinilytica]|uniref:Pleiotropic regulatory protein DegT n=1 Tax=Gottschalkia purinilytica TaxID=1503 RepID=A0A0L0WDY3_GOTPU|nr:DegT/DnrJ/EryC1/StrS family aminotransferase [Gottschalkia purinilytica]KNF09646.1 pleiotropic regulatory protein DegT [Gottschalkia purinilytica]